MDIHSHKEIHDSYYHFGLLNIFIILHGFSPIYWLILLFFSSSSLLILSCSVWYFRHPHNINSLPQLSTSFGCPYVFYSSGYSMAFPFLVSLIKNFLSSYSQTFSSKSFCKTYSKYRISTSLLCLILNKEFSSFPATDL